MKIFDDLFRGKKPPTALNGAGVSVSNSGKKVHRDIGKRTQTLSVNDPSDGPQFLWTFRNVTDILAKILVRGAEFLSRMTLGNWILVTLVLFLSYIVYGVGFVIRTERNIQSLLTSENSDIASPRISRLLDTLWRDYQVLGVIAENPIFPLEPLASYGRILRGMRHISASIDGILTLQPQLLSWTKQREEVSIFPLLDIMFATGSDVHQRIENLTPSLQAVSSLNPTFIQSVDHYRQIFASFISHRALWYEVLGSKAPIRILLLNQNSDELR